jgi:hypothetical protein
MKTTDFPLKKGDFPEFYSQIPETASSSKISAEILWNEYYHHLTIFG